MITFGQGDRRNQILSLISELGPIDEAALANEYENRYGVKAATLEGVFFVVLTSIVKMGFIRLM